MRRIWRIAPSETGILEHAMKLLILAIGLLICSVNIAFATTEGNLIYGGGDDRHFHSTMTATGWGNVQKAPAGASPSDIVKGIITHIKTIKAPSHIDRPNERIMVALD